MPESNILRLPAPAKLNLMLRIVGQRQDGYHLLQTVFQLIDYCDWITLECRQDGHICLRTPLPGVPEEMDLTVRAAHVLRKYTGVQLGVSITVEKNIPMGGGLGGGSSDAATTLVGLNQLWRTGLSLDELASLALTLGADVPVFVYGRSAWAEGVGEILTPLELPNMWYSIVIPDCHVATGVVFSSTHLTRDNKPITIGDFTMGCQGNDCLPVVRLLYPEVDSVIREVSRYSEARLTGTGACVFSVFEKEEEARQVADILGERRSVLVAQGVNNSLLHRTFNTI